MIIGIDGNEANVKEKVGVSVYTHNLLNYFSKAADNKTRFVVYLRNTPINLPKANNFFNYEVVPGKFLWSQIFLPIKLYQEKKIDVFFSPAHYLPRFCPSPSIVTIHDLSYLLYPEDFLKKDLYQLKNWTKYSLKKAEKIIAVSETTKKDLINYYSLSPEKIKVVYNGFEKTLKETEENMKIDKPYFLYVGTLQPRKNIGLLISAFLKFKEEDSGYKLIIVGKKGWLYESILNQVNDLGLQKDIVFTEFLPENKLIQLYKNAHCFIMPSLYEGFGIPLLEAMNYGCPVIAANTSSLPEIGGNACLYFDPKNEEDLKNKMKLISNNKNISEDLIKKGRIRVKNFSWEKCGRETLEIIKSSAFV